MLYLVINNNHKLKYKDRYKIFKTSEAALKHAKSVGYEDPYGMGQDWKPGMLNIFNCGDVDVGIIALEISD